MDSNNTEIDGTWNDHYDTEADSVVWTFQATDEKFDGYRVELGGIGPFTWTVAEAGSDGEVLKTGTTDGFEEGGLAAGQALLSAYAHDICTAQAKKSPAGSPVWSVR